MTRRRARSRLASVAVAVAFVVVLLQSGPGREIMALGNRPLAPLAAAFSGVGDAVADVADTVGRARHLAEENRALRAEVARLQAELEQRTELELENRDLRNLLGLKSRESPGELWPVRVIARDPSPFVQAITIDRGSEGGVRDNMVVITWRGLVGRVIQTYSTSARVLLITDVNSSVSGRIQKPESRATGVVRGRGADGLVMKFIPQDADLRTDDLVITSGLGGIFPEGITIGRVTQVRRMAVEALQEAYLEPVVDMNQLERLFVLGGSE